MLWDNLLLEESPEAECLLSGGCPCLLTGSLVFGLIPLANQALMGLLAEIELGLEETNCWLGEELEVEAIGFAEGILDPFQHLDHSTFFDNADCQETKAMVWEQIIEKDETHSLVVGHIQEQ